MLADLTTVVPELKAFANLELEVAFNKDSCRVGPEEWARLARMLHNARPHFDAFLVVHGTAAHWPEYSALTSASAIALGCLAVCIPDSARVIIFLLLA